MKLVDLILDADVLCALEPEELGLRMLPVLGSWHRHQILHLNELLMTVRGHGPIPPQYPADRTAGVEAAIWEAWAWLEGTALLIPDPRSYDVGRILSRRARTLAAEPDPHRAFSARRILKDSLHPSIREDVWALYHRETYSSAVFEAMRAVEIAVREAAGLSASDLGRDLMRKAFDVKNGPLTDSAAEPAERQARSDLFAGAIGSYKNPHSHRRIDLDDPDEAAEIIMLRAAK